MSKNPTHYAYAVKDRGEGQKPIWTRIGAVFTHQNGEGFTIDFDAFPANGGRVVCTKPKAEEQPAATFEGEAAKQAAKAQKPRAAKEARQ